MNLLAYKNDELTELVDSLKNLLFTSADLQGRKDDIIRQQAGIIRLKDSVLSNRDQLITEQQRQIIVGAQIYDQELKDKKRNIMILGGVVVLETGLLILSMLK